MFNVKLLLQIKQKELNMKMLQVEDKTHSEVKRQALERGMSIKKYVEFMVKSNELDILQTLKDATEAITSIARDNNEDTQLMERYFNMCIAVLEGDKEYCIENLKD